MERKSDAEKKVGSGAAAAAAADCHDEKSKQLEQLADELALSPEELLAEQLALEASMWSTAADVTCLKREALRRSGGVAMAPGSAYHSDEGGQPDADSAHGYLGSSGDEDSRSMSEADTDAEDDMAIDAKNKGGLKPSAMQLASSMQAVVNGDKKNPAESQDHTGTLQCIFER